MFGCRVIKSSIGQNPGEAWRETEGNISKRRVGVRKNNKDRQKRIRAELRGEKRSMNRGMKEDRFGNQALA